MHSTLRLNDMRSIQSFTKCFVIFPSIFNPSSPLKVGNIIYERPLFSNPLIAREMAGTCATSNKLNHLLLASQTAWALPECRELILFSPSVNLAAVDGRPCRAPCMQPPASGRGCVRGCFRGHLIAMVAPANRDYFLVSGRGCVRFINITWARVNQNSHCAS